MNDRAQVAARASCSREWRAQDSTVSRSTGALAHRGRFVGRRSAHARRRRLGRRRGRVSRELRPLSSGSPRKSRPTWSAQSGPSSYRSRRLTRTSARLPIGPGQLAPALRVPARGRPHRDRQLEDPRRVVGPEPAAMAAASTEAAAPPGLPRHGAATSPRAPRIAPEYGPDGSDGSLSRPREPRTPPPNLARAASALGPSTDPSGHRAPQIAHLRVPGVSEPGSNLQW